MDIIKIHTKLNAYNARFVRIKDENTHNNALRP